MRTSDDNVQDDKDNHKSNNDDEDDENNEGGKEDDKSDGDDEDNKSKEDDDKSNKSKEDDHKSNEDNDEDDKSNEDNHKNNDEDSKHDKSNKDDHKSNKSKDNNEDDNDNDDDSHDHEEDSLNVKVASKSKKPPTAVVRGIANGLRWPSSLPSLILWSSDTSQTAFSIGNRHLPSWVLCCAGLAAAGFIASMTHGTAQSEVGHSLMECIGVRAWTFNCRQKSSESAHSRVRTSSMDAR